MVLNLKDDSSGEACRGTVTGTERGKGLLAAAVVPVTNLVGREVEKSMPQISLSSPSNLQPELPLVGPIQKTEGKEGHDAVLTAHLLSARAR